jgi:hypothetical protein
LRNRSFNLYLNFIETLWLLTTFFTHTHLLSMGCHLYYNIQVFSHIHKLNTKTSISNWISNKNFDTNFYSFNEQQSDQRRSVRKGVRPDALHTPRWPTTPNRGRLVGPKWPTTTKNWTRALVGVQSRHSQPFPGWQRRCVLSRSMVSSLINANFILI